MLRILIRAAGALFLASGFVALVVDGARSLAGKNFYVVTLASLLQAIKPTAEEQLAVSLGSVGSGALHSLLMLIPLSLALCAVGAALFVVSHKERAGVASLPEKPAKSKMWSEFSLKTPASFFKIRSRTGGGRTFL
jgi:hypothetical protein